MMNLCGYKPFGEPHDINVPVSTSLSHLWLSLVFVPKGNSNHSVVTTFVYAPDRRQLQHL